MATRFTMSFMVAGSAAAGTAAPTASQVRQVLHEHRPREMMDNLALVIMDQTYNALLEILGPDGHVQVTTPVDPADPASPLLSVNASATHCCISLTDIEFGATTAAPDYYYGSKRWSNTSSQHRLRRATITASPGKLHLARIDGGGGDHWTCAEDVKPDVSDRGLLGVLDAIKKRVNAAIRLEAALLRKARVSGCHGSPEAREVAEVRMALEKMRAAVDVDVFMRRRRCQKRGLLIQEEISCRTDGDRAAYDGAEALANRLSALHVGQKRGRPVQEMSCRQGDDAEVLAKRFRTLRL